MQLTLVVRSPPISIHSSVSNIYITCAQCDVIIISLYIILALVRNHVCKSSKVRVILNSSRQSDLVTSLQAYFSVCNLRSSYSVSSFSNKIELFIPYQSAYRRMYIELRSYCCHITRIFGNFHAIHAKHLINNIHNRQKKEHILCQNIIFMLLFNHLEMRERTTHCKKISV